MDVPISCVCPGTPHLEDTVTLRETLGFRAATTIRWAIAVENAKGAAALAVMTEQGILLGIESWTLVDEAGKPVPVSEETITNRLLTSRQADKVGDAADALYSERVLAPLVEAASTSLPPTPTPSTDDSSSTSAPTVLASKPRKPSKQSSTITSPTVVTEATSTSLDGDSNFSPSSQSAA